MAKHSKHGEHAALGKGVKHHHQLDHRPGHTTEHKDASHSKAHPKGHPPSQYQGDQGPDPAQGIPEMPAGMGPPAGPMDNGAPGAMI